MRETFVSSQRGGAAEIAGWAAQKDEEEEEGDKVRMELSLCFESAIEKKRKEKNNSDRAGVR